MVLTAYVVLSPVIGLFCHRHLADIVLSKPGWADKTPQNLTPASGRQDHTILPSAATSLVRVLLIAHRLITRPAIPSRAQRCCVHRIPHPTSVTIAKRPSWWDGMAGVVDVIWGVRKQKYFCKRDSTGKSERRPTGKSVQSDRDPDRCLSRVFRHFSLAAMS